ncbi:WD40/YVTN/BNR-like repeat-containing protein [Aromatoleum diolicum]|uniref:Glycosyl hydrolase n=1 Tax=Aromatoleum diolicum TaxID=75796 RepID=A0ABX1Q9H6_9RHOO|nr:YCF48-related protein [Aromatoleum diolicum]NMG74958.1 glycosyl hydrolase [Aromatoleum diolicum]
MKKTMQIGRTVVGLCLAASAVAFAAAPADAARNTTAVAAMKARLAAKVPVTGIARAGNALIAVGDYGTIVRSTDEGKTWQQAEVPVSALLTAVHFVDDERGWAVGHGGVILVTSDGGANWQLQTTLDEKPVLLSVHFTDAQRGYAVGAYGVAFVTADGGRNWAPMAVGSGHDADLHLNHVFATREGALFLAAETGVAFRSTDRGGHWTKLATGVSGSLWSGLERSNGEVVLLGMSGRVIASRDGGNTWQVRETGTEQSLTSAIALPNGGMIIVGAGGVVLRGNGDGPMQLEIRPDRQNLAAVMAAPTGAVVVAGQLGVERLAPAR